MAVVLKLDQHGQLGRGLRSEVEADAGLNYFGLTGGLHVRVQNKVCAFVQAQCHAVGFDVGNGAGLPEQQMAVGIEDLGLDADLHSSEAGAGLGFALARGCAHGRPECWRDGRNAYRRDEFRLPSSTVFVDGKAEDKIPICVRALRRQGQRFSARENEVGSSEAPTFDELWLPWQIGWVAFRRALPTQRWMRSIFANSAGEVRRRTSKAADPAAMEACCAPRYIRDLVSMFLDVG